MLAIDSDVLKCHAASISDDHAGRVSAAHWLMPRTMIRDLNRLCFNCFLPVMLFNNVRATDFRQYFEWHLISYAVGSVLLLFVFLLWLVPRVVKRPEQQSVVIQCIYRSN